VDKGEKGKKEERMASGHFGAALYHGLGGEKGRVGMTSLKPGRVELPSAAPASMQGRKEEGQTRRP